jgi:hypothetical protein
MKKLEKITGIKLGGNLKGGKIKLSFLVCSVQVWAFISASGGARFASE